MRVIAVEIEERMDILSKKMTWLEVGKAVGLTKGALSHFKNDGSEMKFQALLNVARFVFKNDYLTTFKSWCLRFNQPKNICYALEHLAVNRQIKELDELISKIKNERNSDQKLVEWADGYRILSMYLKGVEPAEILNQLRIYTPKIMEMKILALLTEVWCRNKMREYSTMESLITGLDLSISEIKDSYIKESYSLRLKESLAFINLFKKNNAEIARKYAEEIISSDFCATFTTNASYLIGMSYLFDNYDKCLGNILRYRELLEENGRYQELKIVDQNDIPFIKNVWNKHTKQPETNDISEVAHYEAVAGDKKVSLELVDKAIEENGKSGFKLYYKALATGDKTLFMESLIFFINKKGDKFYANLPFKHLKDDPIYHSMADLLFNN